MLCACALARPRHVSLGAARSLRLGGVSGHLLGITDGLVKRHRLPLVGDPLHRRRLAKVRVRVRMRATPCIAAAWLRLGFGLG